MVDINFFLEKPSFSLHQQKKESLLTTALSELTNFHLTMSSEYNQIVRKSGIASSKIERIEDIPFIPVRLFKEYDLLSIDQSEVIKTMTSSGTTGQNVSKIFLDRETSINQTKVLSKIVSSYIGQKRLPMLIIDSEITVKNRYSFSARGAGILGFSMFGRDITYALDENMEININAIEDFIKKYENEPILLFGFTFIVWEHFYKQLKSRNIRLKLDNGVLIHGGGWKKLIEEAVENSTFKSSIYNVSGITKIHNYYGMVEQTGSIFMECEYGHLHASIYSDVLIRDHKTFDILPKKEQGLIQLLSLLPRSYPGHSILSEDLGEWLGEDDCPCGRLGKYFKIHGRIKNAEIRGCSDTYAHKF